MNGCRLFAEPGRAGERGFIIVAVLWILAGLAALAAVYSIYVANAAISMSVLADEVQVEALVSASLELTAYQLLASKREERPTRGQFVFRLSRANVSVEFCSEAARIDLNLASKELLAGLFVVLGASSDDADQYADRIIGWRTAPSNNSQDREGSLYRAAGLAYGPRGAPFAHPAELALVLGLPPAMVESAMPYVTVYSGRAEINVLDAAPTVVAALPGMNPGRLGAFLSERATLSGPSALSPLGAVQNLATTEGSKATRVNVRARLDNGRQIVSEVVILIDGGDEPYRVLSWQDDVDAQPSPPIARAQTNAAVRR
jgi:general secretion pathway protein K